MNPCAAAGTADRGADARGVNTQGEQCGVAVAGDRADGQRLLAGGSGEAVPCAAKAARRKPPAGRQIISFHMKAIRKVTDL